MTKLKSPICWFGGGGSLLLTKEPSPVEVYNDLSVFIKSRINIYRTINTIYII